MLRRWIKEYQTDDNGALINKSSKVSRDLVANSLLATHRLIGQKSFKEYILSAPHEIDHLDDMPDKSPMWSVDQ